MRKQKDKFKDILSEKNSEAILVFRSSKRLKKILDDFAAREGLSASHVVRIAVLKYLQLTDTPEKGE